MSIKLSICTTMTAPRIRGDNPKVALECYKELADEVVVVDGTYAGSTDYKWHNDLFWDSTLEGYSPKFKRLIYEWDKEFSWPFIGDQFTRAYEACTGDWVIRADADMIFHQNDYARIRQALRDYPNAPAISFFKHQFILPDRYNLKSRLLLAINKKIYGNRIILTGGGDLCQPQLDSKDLDIDEMPQAGIPFYNYEKICKTEPQIKDDVGRMDRAYYRHFGKYIYGVDGSDESAYEGWLKMVVGRFNKPQQHIKLEEHPLVMQETIRNLRPDQFGYNGFSHLPKNDYVR